MSKINSFKSKKIIKVNGKDYVIYSLPEAEKNGLKDISKLPKSLKVLLENLLRYEDNSTVDKNQINAIQSWLKTKTSDIEIGCPNITASASIPPTPQPRTARPFTIVV